ncbi:MAG: hypothetical protein MK221_00450 [Gemmatimonadetes bacterium]|nr:hypothetical protein [Gemmatimonadota bacterium]
MRTKIRFRGTVSLMSLGVLAGMNVACEATPRTSETEEAWKSSLDKGYMLIRIKTLRVKAP